MVLKMLIQRCRNISSFERFTLDIDEAPDLNRETNKKLIARNRVDLHGGHEQGALNLRQHRRVVSHTKLLQLRLRSPTTITINHVKI